MVKNISKIYTYSENIKCVVCNSSYTYIAIDKRSGIGYPFWITHKDGKICKKCYNKLKSNIKYKYIRYKYRHLFFCGIRLFLSFELPRDKCEICNKNKDDVKKMDRHHYFYCRIMPWACTISVCGICHQSIIHKKKNRK